jgi:hypothetical protein
MILLSTLNRNEYIKHVTNVLKVLKEYNLFVKLEISKFYINKSIFLHIQYT